MSITLTDLYRDDSLEAQKRKNFGELVDWEEHAKTLTSETEIQIEPNKYRFKDNKLVITKEQFPNLKLLYACGLGLDKVELDHDGLENLYLVDNNLTQIDFKKTPNLKNLVLSKNKLRKLRVKHLKKLEDLRVNINWLINLDVRGLTNLKNLDASDCYGELSPIKNLKRFQWLQWVKLGNNPKLIKLDLAENSIRNTNFPPLPNLEEISLRENRDFFYGFSFFFNDYDETLTLRSPKLTFLDYHGSNIEKVIHKLGLENPSQLQICNDESYEDEDGTYNPDVATEYEQVSYNLQQQKEREDFAVGKHIYQGQKYLDLSNQNFIKKIVIDGEINYPKSLESINLGGNYFEKVIIRNLPNLKQLIISHNNVKKLVIEKCPQLQITYHYKSDDQTRTAPSDAQEYDEERDNPFKQQEREEQLWQEQAKQEQKEKEGQKERETLNRIMSLLSQAEEALNNKDYQELARLIKEMKELVSETTDTGFAPAIHRSISEFEHALLTQNTNPNNNHLSWIIGSIVIMPIIYLVVTKLVVNVKKKSVRKKT